MPSGKLDYLALTDTVRRMIQSPWVWAVSRILLWRAGHRRIVGAEAAPLRWSRLHWNHDGRHRRAAEERISSARKA